MGVTVPEPARNGQPSPSPPFFVQPRWRWFATVDEVSATNPGLAELSECVIHVAPAARPALAAGLVVLGRQRRDKRAEAIRTAR
jgi:hypothetical protein